ncbi:class I SAM-dependent methyltransferase [Proteiniborus sp. MB09-C3]|uniref:class I SAM-dependent methyltransferase n=1 Tax=Proteiniborus sp. MB09-C3 TaxID=3050072 RepID=UPI002552D54E|nr:class I SAM-dependent methyltransferase [Proteiniborus sp. MB09-C3]WIV12485.1 class I SAM-dependent methyltransferase [Proteiniborus sp. MB09-C3]
MHPKLEAASRSHGFMDKSVEWIQTIASPEVKKNVLDLGCGPGLYAQRLSSKGYSITGIDFSKRSIEYAREQAKRQGYNIKYIYMDYLEMDYNDEFDLVLLIYCDFGVLSHEQRRILLQKIYSAMKEGGKFIFDVFTPKNYEGKQESKDWYLNQGSGFWKPETHLCLQTHYIYEDNIRLDQYVIIDHENKIEVIRVWNCCYTKETIRAELERVGFKNIKIYSDVSSKVYDEESKTMCIVVEK